MKKNNSYVVNVEAAIFKQDKWLMGKRSDQENHAAGLYSMIGGKVENAQNDNNILESTLKREVIEEVGITVCDDIYYVKSSSFIADFGSTVIDIVLLCRYNGGEPRALQPEELSAVAWMTIDEILADENIPTYTKESLKIAERMRLKLQAGALL
ncbi:MAG: NUDIX hydrolase [candidate division TM6 bacterium GW2011_GWF2_37_49]|nr:MAG: NUDIX hydrolase [candidate division TM6 bacterium GW2011_GWF2_37_49]